MHAMSRVVAMLALQRTTLALGVSCTLVLSAKVASGQQKQPSALSQCRADNEALRGDLARLRQEIDDLRRTTTQRAEEAGDAPYREALAALHAVESVVTTGSYLDFKKYFLEAKVKVDALPPTDRSFYLREALDAYADAEFAWNSYVTNRQLLLERNISNLFFKYPDLHRSARVLVAGGGGWTSYYLDSVVGFFAALGKDRLAGPASRSEASHSAVATGVKAGSLGATRQGIRIVRIEPALPQSEHDDYEALLASRISTKWTKAENAGSCEMSVETDLNGRVAFVSMGGSASPSPCTAQAERAIRSASPLPLPPRFMGSQLVIALRFESGSGSSSQ